MWRDALIILALIFSILTYFNLTPKRLSGHFYEATKVASKRLSSRIIILATVLISSVFIIVDILIHIGGLRLSTVLFVLSMHIIVSYAILSYFFDFSSGRRKVIQIAIVIVFLSLFLAGIFTSDIPIWRKIVMPISGFAGGFAVRWLIDYMKKRIKSRQTTQEKQRDC